LATVTAERDSLRSERDVARVEAQDARRRADEAERGMMTAQARIEALKGSWWRWKAMLATVGVVGRLRRRWPDDPSEFDTPLLLASPERGK
jgi:hypothetical protein